MRLTGSQANEAYITPIAKEKGVGVWDFRGRRQFTERRKQLNVGKQMFAGPYGNSGTERNFNRLLNSSLSTTPGPYYAVVNLW